MARVQVTMRANLILRSRFPLKRILRPSRPTAERWPSALSSRFRAFQVFRVHAARPSKAYTELKSLPTPARDSRISGGTPQWVNLADRKRGSPRFSGFVLCEGAALIPRATRAHDLVTWW